MIQRQRTTETVDADGRLPEKLRKTYRDEGFILHKDKKLIAFTKKTNLYILKQNKHWFADGTFKVNYQSNFSFSFPIFFHVSVEDMLPNIFHNGFLFHFSQAVCRQVQSKGLTTKYNEDKVFRLNVKQLIALAFAPLDQIITGFDLICDQFDDDADDLLEYFEKTCFGELKISGKYFSLF
ncbi:unnamed protein product [Rotaria magnacalcarata]|uniref:Uncharacterized protein n=1 Tax=Rotaria magnacalcarata TaxID=392030 RepID=A0A820GTG0_9BILA|nr:unnamed protein product [Rotaria magnacalcarata]